MTILAQDTCIRANQTGLGTPSDGVHVWAQSRGTQLLSIVSNQGKIAYNGSTTLGVETLNVTSANTDVTVNVSQSGLTDILGAALRFAGTSFYYCDIGNLAGKLEIGKCISGTFTSLGNAAFTYAVNTLYTIRFQAIGTQLQGKIWIAGNAEPASWMITLTDVALASGLAGVCAAPLSGQADLFDHLTITDANTIQAFSETTTVIESFALADATSASEQAAQAETYALAGATSATEAQTIIDGLALAGAATGTEAATGIESWLVSASASGSDQGQNNETLALSGAASATETTPIGETFMLAGLALSAEQIAAIEQFATLANLSQSEVTQVIETFFSGNPIANRTSKVTWKTRTGKTTWTGRSGRATWTTRTGKTTWTARG